MYVCVCVCVCISFMNTDKTYRDKVRRELYKNAMSYIE